MIDIRDQFIAQVVNGRSFAEVGGLWGTVNEKVSVAHDRGATDLTMIDITLFDPDPLELWVKFSDRMKQFNIQNYHCISQDICQLLDASETPQFDVVHCAGVLYHHPNPLLLLTALRRITRGHLVLTSAVSQQVIRTDAGEYRLPASACLFVPALDGNEFEVQRQYWSKVAAPVAQGLTERCFFDLEDFGPWWWLPTPSTMLAMCEAVGFKAIDLSLTWNNNALTLLLKSVTSEEDRTPQVLARSETVKTKLRQIEQDVSKGNFALGNGSSDQISEEPSADLQAQLQQAHSRVEKLQKKLQEAKQAEHALHQAEDRIRAMETSKFWRMRRMWFKLKQGLGVRGE